MATAEKPVAGQYEPSASTIEPPKSPLARLSPIGLFLLLVLMFVPTQIWGSVWGLDETIFLWLRLVAYGGALVILAVPALRGRMKGYIAAILAAALIDAHVYGWNQAQVDPGKLVEKAPYL